MNTENINRKEHFVTKHHIIDLSKGEIISVDNLDVFGYRFPAHSVNLERFDWKVVEEALKELFYENPEDFKSIFEQLSDDSTGMLVLKKMVNEEKVKKLKEISMLNEYL